MIIVGLTLGQRGELLVCMKFEQVKVCQEDWEKQPGSEKLNLRDKQKET